MDAAKGFLEALDEIQNKYVKAKTTPFGGSTPVGEAFRRAGQGLQGLLESYPHLRVKASHGQGNWAEVPWIAILDSRLTSTTQRGVYCVLLFRADMSGVYMTFNQGVTELRKDLGWTEARNKLLETSELIRERFRSQLSTRFVLSNEIDLRCSQQSASSLGVQYEASTIAWKLYERGNLPSEAEFLEDLHCLLPVYEDFASNPVGNSDQFSEVQSGGQTMSADDSMGQVNQLINELKKTGYSFEPWQVATFVTALRTKPFVILAGISGTGKSRLPRLIGDLTGADVEMIPVRPDWTDSSELLGYNNLKGEFIPGRLLKFAKQASDNPHRFHIAVLDEMNLARVEQYFAEALSILEDRVPAQGGGFESREVLVPQANDDWSTVKLPANLAVVGTVNMDETTHGFSRKVLDRAFTIEMSEVDLSNWNREGESQASALSWSLTQWQPRACRPGELSNIPGDTITLVDEFVSTLTQLNTLLSPAQLQVGYRVRDEAAMFLIHAAEAHSDFVTTSGTRVDQVDLALHMKVLPRIQGGSSAIRGILSSLIGWARDGNDNPTDEDVRAVYDQWAQSKRPASLEGFMYPRTLARLCLMWDRLQVDGFTSYWL